MSNSKYSGNVPRQLGVSLITWANSAVSRTVEDVIQELPTELQDSVIHSIYRFELPKVKLFRVGYLLACKSTATASECCNVMCNLWLG